MFPGMGGGRGGMDPRKLQQMMKQLGIDIEEVDDVEEVVIRTASGEIHIDDAEVTIMDAQGQRTFQIVGDVREEELEAGPGFDDEDVELVMDQAGVSEEEAVEALEAADGRPADAIVALSEG